MSNDTKEKNSGYTIAGKVRLETLDEIPGDVNLTAYAFTDKGCLLKTASVDQCGNYQLEFPANNNPDIELHIGESGDQEGVKKNSLYSRSIQAREWDQANNKRTLPVVAYLPKLVWWPWWPKQICVSGHVRKTPNCPVPFARVEIFDVDREWCFWPHLHRFKDLLIKNRVLRLEDIAEKIPDIPDLVREIPEPVAPPFGDISNDVINTREQTGLPDNFGFEEGLLQRPDMPLQADIGNNVLSENVAQGPNALSAITATSIRAPWVLFPHCYHGRQLICTTTTDENGYFRCCFRWWPLHVRHGHLSQDWRPDVIIRVTQVIDGVSRVIYMDPYSNTRWNVTNLHVDLYLDDPDIECGSSDDQDRPEGSRAFFTRIGNDEVYRINQTDGTYDDISTISNMAYGRALRIFAQFGDTLSRLENIPGATRPYYYKLSYDGVPVTTALRDTRVNKSTLLSESYVLGPHVVGSEAGLFEVRNFKDYYWYNPDWIGYWITVTTSTDPVTGESVVNKNVSDGVRVLKLEIFDGDGTLLDSTRVDYLDGTQAPPAILPAIYPCTMKIAIDNNPPVIAMNINPAPTGCGVIKSVNVPPLDVNVSVTQANNRVRSWRLSYVKGTDPTVNYLASGADNAGGAVVVSNMISANDMLTGLTSTCAFSVELNGWAHIRNGYGLVYHRRKRLAIAVEQCP